MEKEIAEVREELEILKGIVRRVQDRLDRLYALSGFAIPPTSRPNSPGAAGVGAGDPPYSGVSTSAPLKSACVPPISRVAPQDSRFARRVSSGASDSSKK